MYKKVLIAVTGVMFLFGCSAKPNTETVIEHSNKCEALSQMPGGWQKGEVTPEVTKAAQAAVSSLKNDSNLKTIQSVTQQVVAGMNYQIYLTTDNGIGYVANVYQNLQNEYTVNSITLQSELTDCNTVNK